MQTEYLDAAIRLTEGAATFEIQTRRGLETLAAVLFWHGVNNPRVMGAGGLKHELSPPKPQEVCRACIPWAGNDRVVRPPPVSPSGMPSRPRPAVGPTRWAARMVKS